MIYLILLVKLLILKSIAQCICCLSKLLFRKLFNTIRLESMHDNMRNAISIIANYFISNLHNFC